ncbi:hypothetical protein KDC22_07865 [Paenibacillus tritici]|uniref:hypothetical protein n=1 Tax=Paenibacillus tritici TaxID=1873425 RepID=UPI001BA4F69D|nr:hypothetical protein [Paenibacillus tritici]QUL56406.1 hypothetical protein KDC22_07865 [Paenibacillus tritici]
MIGSFVFVGVVVYIAILGINHSNRNARHKNYGNRNNRSYWKRNNSADSFFFPGVDPNISSGDSRDNHRHHDGHSGASHHHGHHTHDHNHGGSSWGSGSHGGWDSGGHGGGDSGGGDGGGGGGGD